MVPMGEEPGFTGKIHIWIDDDFNEVPEEVAAIFIVSKYRDGLLVSETFGVHRFEK